MIKTKAKNALIPKLLGTVLVIPILISGCQSQKSETSQTAAKPQAIPVQLKTLESAILVESSEYVGTLEAQGRVNLAPRINGRILRIFVQEGDRVVQGDSLVELEPTQQQEEVNAANENVNIERARLGEIKAQVKTAEAERARAAADVERAKADLQDVEAELKLARINIERSQMLVEGGALPRQDLDDKTRDLETLVAQVVARKEALNATREAFQAAERRVEQALANIESQNSTIARAEAQLGSVSQNLAFNTINAPISGIVGSFDQKKVGDYVNAGQTITTITNNQAFNLNIGIPTEYRSRLKLGLPVEIVQQNNRPGIRGSIAYIAPLVTESTQSILTKVAFPSNSSLRDNEYVRVRVIWSEKPGLLVPTTAITRLGGQKFVFVATPKDGNLVAQKVPIEVGDIQGQSYQIISGLQEGDQIAVTRILDLKDGTTISEEALTSEQTDN